MVYKYGRNNHLIDLKTFLIKSVKEVRKRERLIKIQKLKDMDQNGWILGYGISWLTSFG